MVTPVTPLVRNDYAAGGRMTAADFARDQDYHRAVQALRCQGLHTPGVAFGLGVSLAGGQAVSVAPGMAVDTDGRQIVLLRETVVDLSAQTGTVLYLTIAGGDRPVGWTTAPTGAGYARIEEDVRLAVTPTVPLPGGAELVLARLTITPERRLEPPDNGARTLCGVVAGHLSFPPPDGALPAPSLAMEAGAAPLDEALVIDAALTDVFGALRVTDNVVVGPAAAPDACLAVQTPKPVQGAGRISSKGVYILGADAYDLASLAPGDQLIVPFPAAADDTGTPTLTVVAVAGQTVTVAQAPATPLVASTYAVNRADLLRIRPQPMTLALAVSTHGRIGIGGEAAGSASSNPAALSVRGGALLLETGHAARFTADGTVSAQAGARAIRLLASERRLEIRDAGALAFRTGGAAGAGLFLTAAGRVGIGTDAPTQRLSVAGEIRASGGVIFPDGSHQTDGVVAIPIGTIVTWWRPEGATAFLGAGFQLCDGSTITDPSSPLVGLKTPNLNGAFLRGAVNFEEIGQTGGALTHTHGFALPPHTHPMPHTHQVTGNTTSVNGVFGDQFTRSCISTADHIHTIEGDSGTARPGDTASSSSMQPGATAAASSVPPYLAMLCAIRIR